MRIKCEGRWTPEQLAEQLTLFLTQELKNMPSIQYLNGVNLYINPEDENKDRLWLIEELMDENGDLIDGLVLENPHKRENYKRPKKKTAKTTTKETPKPTKQRTKRKPKAPDLLPPKPGQVIDLAARRAAKNDNKSAS